ncbi:MAG TPA: DUF6788 family protein, partial [Chloroflexota bacterium]|nr:DUF6788 family protein [Chloroflexota bacterium]
MPEGLLPTYTQQYRRCGKAACPLCAAGGRGHGPYWYAYWREGGRTRSRYLGKRLPAGAATPHLSQAEPSAAHGTQPTRPDLRVQTLDGFAVWRGEVRLPAERWERQKVGALCKWLLGAPGHRLTRDAVVERFWPEGTLEQGTANLRVLVHRLRKALDGTEGDESYVQYDGEIVALPPDKGQQGSWLDADGFASAAHAALAGRDAAACRAALALYTGEYLPGDAYEEWALERREQLQQQRIALLLHQATLCAADGEIEAAVGCLRAVLAADRCHEAAALALMRLHTAAGQPAQALRIYRRLAEALRQELDLEPEEETGRLYHALLAQQAVVRPIAPAEPGPPRNLPAPLTSFIGRRHALTAIHNLLTVDATSVEVAPCRLLTLTGLGGAGKTRLALQVADGLLDEPGHYPDGVWLVELAALADPMLVPAAVSGILGVREQPDISLLESIIAFLQPKRVLLVLDNCEHLIDACATLVTAVL